MKQNTLQNNPLTKKDLLDALEKFSHTTDKRIISINEEIKRLREEIRHEIKKEILASETRSEIRIDIKLEKMELRMDDRARIYNSQVLTKFDQWANDLKNAQIEQVITTDQLTKIHQDIDNLKKRMTKMEAS